MTAFIFCLIFIQVAIFLGVGVVLFSTFFLSASEAAAPRQELQGNKLNHFDVSEVRLTRSEVEYLLAS